MAFIPGISLAAESAGAWKIGRIGAISLGVEDLPALGVERLQNIAQHGA